MRVVSVAFTQYRRDGRVRRACEALAARGDEVTAITLAEPGRPDRERMQGVDVWRIPVERLSLSSRQTKGRYLAEYATYAAETVRRLWRLHAERPLDLIHVNNMPDALVAVALPLKARGVPVLLDVHDLMPDLYVNKFGGRADGPAARALVAETAASAALADAVLTVTDDARDWLEAYGVPRDRIHVVLNAADNSHFTWRGFKEPQDPFVIAYHGSISRRHGLDLAVRAVADARRRVDVPLRFKIVGEGDAVEEVGRLIGELGLEDVVDFHPRFIPVEELAAFLQDADLGLVPYRRDRATDLMLACKLFDFGAVGIPSISSRLKVISRYFDESHVRYVEPGEVDALADAVVELVGDVDERRSLVRRMRERVDALGWPVQKAAYLDLVDRTAGRGRPRRLIPGLLEAVGQAVKGLSRPAPTL